MAKITAHAFDHEGMSQFLSHLDQIHLVAIHKSRPDVHGKYFGEHVESAVEWAQVKNANGFNIYWTVNRVRNGFDQKPKKSDIVAARYIHVDIDPPRSNEHDFSVAATIETLENLRCPPTFIINSGNGLQSFWELDGDYANLDSIERINLQVRGMFSADSCQNIDRLMRVPGAVNHPSLIKEARGRKPTMASVIMEHTGQVYEPEELAAFFPPAEITEAAERALVEVSDYELLTSDDLGLTPFHPLRRALEKPKGDDRSAYGYHAACEAVREHLTDAQVAGLLLNPANPASAHFIDQEHPLRAVKRAIGRARGVEEIEETDEAPEVPALIDFSKLVANSLAKAEKVRDTRTISVTSEEEGAFDWYAPLRGGMKEMVDTIIRYAPSPRPELALGSAIALFAAAAGRLYQTPSGLMTNIYTVALSASGSGKNLPVKAPASVLINARLENLVGGSEVVSGRGIMTALETYPSIYLPIDEMGKLVAAMHDPRGNLREAINVLLKMYSAADETVKGAMYANNKDRPTNLLVRPCLGLYGVATPESFWDKLTKGSVADGLLPRFILIVDERPNEPPPRRLQRPVYPDSLLDAVKAVRSGAEGHNAFPMGEGSTTACNPYRVEFADSEADEFEYQMRLRQYEMENVTDGEMRPFVRRLAENAMKLALVMAVSENPAAPMLTKRHMEWGWGLSYRSVQEFIRQVAGNVSENEYEAKAKAVEASIRATEADGATLSVIGRKCGWISGPERSQILDDLEARGVIEKVVHKPRTGRPSARYFMAGLSEI